MPPAAETLPPLDAKQERCRRIARSLGLVGFAVGLCVLAGWAFHLPSLISVFPGLVAMKSNMAIGLCLGGWSLFLLTGPARGTWQRRVSATLAGAMVLLGTLTLAEYLVGRSFGLDEWLFRDPYVSDAPGRMAPVTAANLVCLGLALWCLQWPGKIIVAQALTVVPVFTSVLAIVSYLYGVSSLYKSGHFTAVALHTSVTLLLLCVGVWCAGSRVGFMRVVTNAEMSGTLVRRCGPVALVLPFFIGWLRVQGISRGWYSGGMGVVLVAMANATTFVVVLCVGACPNAAGPPPKPASSRAKETFANWPTPCRRLSGRRDPTEFSITPTAVGMS